MVKLSELRSADEIHAESMQDPEYRRAYLLEQFGEMTLLELRDFMREFRETFGVTDTIAPVTPILPVPVDEPEEIPDYRVTLLAAGTGKIQVIKTVREIMKLGLKEAKDFVDALPQVILDRGDKDEANLIAAKLVGAGASVGVDPVP